MELGNETASTSKVRRVAKGKGAQK